VEIIKHVEIIKDRRGTYTYKGLVEKSEEKRQLGKPRRGKEDNIKINLHEVGGVRDWNDLA
jgi:hypothetical protein